MGKKKLWNIRKQVKLCSLYYSDYETTYGYDSHKLCDFFDGYADYLEELMEEEIENFDDSKYFDYLEKYDTAENLYDWCNYMLDEEMVKEIFSTKKNRRAA